MALLRPLAAILLPDRRVGVEVAAGRYGLPLLIVLLCGALAAIAVGSRLDLRPEILAENAGAKKPSTPASLDETPAEIKTDREIDEATAHRTAVTRVKLGLGVGFQTPGRVLFLAFGILLLGRFVGGKVTTPRALAAAALVTLPGAFRSLVIAIAAWHQPAIGTADVGALASGAALPIPAGHPGLARLLGGVDLFTCWSIVIFVYAFVAAAELKRSKGVVAAAVGVVLYLLVTGLIMTVPPPPGATG